MMGIVDPVKDKLEMKCHDDYKWAAFKISTLTAERDKYHDALVRLGDADLFAEDEFTPSQQVWLWLRRELDARIDYANKVLESLRGMK